MSIRQAALEAHRILQEYIAIHNDIFGGSWWRKILPIPGLFQAINFEHNAISLKALEKELEQLKEKVENLTTCFDDLTSAFTLINYIDALKLTLAKLRSICINLHLKAQGQPYSIKEYKQAMHAYQQLVALYKQVGAELNAAFESM